MTIPRSSREAAQMAHFHRAESQTHFANRIHGSKKSDFEPDHSTRWIIAGVVFCVVLIAFIWSHKP